MTAPLRECRERTPAYLKGRSPGRSSPAKTCSRWAATLTSAFFLAGNLQRSIWRAVFSLYLIVTSSGCLWVSGTAAGVAATSGSHGGKRKEPPPPDPVVLDTTRASGPFRLLEDGALAAAVGEFMPAGPDAGALNPDVAVAYQGKPRISFFPGDGKGQLGMPTVFPGGSGNVVAIAAVPGVPGAQGRLLVLTPRTLDLVEWSGTASEGAFRIAGVQDLGIVDPDRDLALGDFDGDKVTDVAISDSVRKVVEFFSIPVDGGEFRSLGQLALGFQVPRSIVAADFYPDPLQTSDLAVIVAAGSKTSLQLYLARTIGNGDWCSTPAASVDLPDDGFLLAKPAVPGGIQDLNGDSIPDLAYTRTDGTGSALVKRAPLEKGGVLQEGALKACEALQDAWELDLKNRGGGHFSPAPAAISLLKLPGGQPGAWDRVTVDSNLDAVVCSYMKCDGVNLHTTVSYATPGSGRALAVGDLDGDSFDDIVAVTADADRSTLMVLLSDSPPDVENLCGKDFQRPSFGPYFYPGAASAGESPQTVSAVLDVDFGHAGPNETAPFLAVVDRNNGEVTIFMLGVSTAGVPEVIAEERYPTSVNRPTSISVSDLDGGNGDDLLVVGDEGFDIFFNRGSAGANGSHFDSPDVFWAKDFAYPVPGERFTGGVLLRDAQVGPLDLVPLPDFVIPVATERQGEDGKPLDDFIAVVLNPGSPGGPRIDLYNVPDSPHDLAIANLNNDSAMDLLVACDKPKKVLVLFGDPEHPGEFFDAADDPNPPMLLDSRTEVANVATENSPLASRKFQGLAPVWPRARWIVISNEQDILGFALAEDLDQSPNSAGYFRPRIGDSCVVQEARDPESILVADLFGHPGRELDLAVVDESADHVIILKNKLKETGDPCGMWSLKGHSPEVGSPQRVAPFSLGGGFFLAVASRSREEVMILERRGTCPEDCNFEEVSSIKVPRVNVIGGSCAMALKRTRDGVACFQVVEDGLSRGGKSAVDMTVLGAGPASFRNEDVLKVGAGNRATRTTRLSIPAEQPISAILLGDEILPGNGVQLLVCDGGRSISCHQISMNPPGELESKASQRLIELDDDLVDWALLPPAGGPLQLWAATSSRVSLYSVNPSDRTARKAAPVWTCPTPYTVKRAAQGWLSKGRDPRSDLFFAILEDQQLFVEVAPAKEGPGQDGLPRRPYPQPLPLPTASLLRCVCVGDLNGDDRDDIVVADQNGQALHVLLAEDGGGGDGRAHSPTFRWKQTISYSPLFLETVGMAFLHANTDSHLDLCLGASSGEVLVFLGNGHGSFSEPHLLYAGPGLEALRVADVDLDGLDEILLSVALPGLIVLPGIRSPVE